MESFFESYHCTSQAHCWTCRDLVGGRAWRQSIRKHFHGLDTDDWDCPHGFAWGDGPSRGLGDTVKKLIQKATFGKAKPCGGCRKRQKILGQRFAYKERKSAWFRSGQHRWVLYRKAPSPPGRGLKGFGPSGGGDLLMPQASAF